MEVTLHEGAVLHRKHTVWVQCPDCGPQPPAVQWNAVRERWMAEPRVDLPFFSPLPRTLTCSRCDKDAPYKEIAIPRNGTGKVLHCNRRCLDAKGDDCNCLACLGGCTGEGKCSCPTADV